MPEITLSAEVESVPAALEFLAVYLEGRSQELRMHVELAVEELFVNVASYAYPKGDTPCTLQLGCRWVSMDDQEQFCVWIRDWGHPFNPFLNVSKPDTSASLEERNIGGLGVHFVRHITNHYVYIGADGSNTVELYFAAS